MGDGPTRMCVACRARRLQSDLLAVVKGPCAVWAGSAAGDRRNRPPGRGAYLCSQRSCVELAWKSGALRRALRHDGPFPEGLHADLVARVESERKT